jgi:beta-lactamase regulating signal transducer with metallopeptidase domain/peptidoglycan/xylan/chitin deacetylase (PgdA/CDA1 family)
MNWIDYANSKAIADLGWTLAHSVWQIAVAAAALFILLKIVRNASPNFRYVVSVTFLFISAALPVTTYLNISKHGDHTTGVGLASGGASSRDRFPEDPAIIDPAAELTLKSTISSLGSTAAVDRVRAAFADWLEKALPFLVGVWLVGVGLFAARLGGGFWQIRRLRRAKTESLDEKWRASIEKIIARVGLRQRVEVMRSTLVDTPIAIGLLRPIVLIPAAAFLHISPRELETVIAHELIHIRRLDPLVNVLQSVVETIFFYHPAIWWISREIRREREFAADAAVIETFEDTAVDYARALANLEQLRQSANTTTPLLAAAINGGNLMVRIERILKIKTEAGGGQTAWTAGMALLLTSALLTVLFLSTDGNLVNAQRSAGSKKIAIGFVSIPPVDRTANAPKDAEATARLLIEKLKRHNVPAIGFLQGSMISDGEKMYPVRAGVAKMWKDAGFDVGIGGYKHIWLYHTPADDYIANIEKNERAAKQLFGDQAAIRYFSYPYLNTGKTVEDRAKVESWLASRGYTPVKYTIDNQEWMYSYAYDMARNDNDVNTMKEIREAYLSYMSKMFDHYETYSREMFARDIAQTMVLTPSRLITDTADEFFAMLTKRGYSFVSIDEAQADDAYKTQENFVGKSGISWFERWALARNMKLRPEPAVDPAVERTWNARETKK